MVMPIVTETPVEHDRVHLDVPRVVHAFPDGSDVALCGARKKEGAPRGNGQVECLTCRHLARQPRSFVGRAA